jgi:multidrug transporter EmrE-like cation transporter
LLVTAIACEVGATLSLRASDGFSKWGWAFPVAIGGVVLITGGVFLLEYGADAHVT